MIRHNPQPPRSGLASDFWRAVVSSAFWNTKEVPRQLQEEARRRVAAEQPPLTLEECVSITADTLDQPFEAVRVHILNYLAAYVRRSFEDATDAIKWLARRDRRLGVWCATQVARWALASVPKPKVRSVEAKNVKTAEAAILATEGWISGEISRIEVRKAADAANDAAYVAVANASCYATYASAYAANVVYADNYPSKAAIAVSGAANAAVVRADYTVRDEARDAKLRMLVGVIADAILGFPTTSARKNPRKRIYR